MSFLCWGLQSWTQDCRCGLTRAERSSEVSVPCTLSHQGAEWPWAELPWCVLLVLAAGCQRVACLRASSAFVWKTRTPGCHLWCVQVWEDVDSLSLVFLGNSHFLLKPHSWSSGVASQTSVDMHRSLCNCLGHLKHERCPKPRWGLLWLGTRHRCPLSRTGGVLCFLALTAIQWFVSWCAACHSKYFWSSAAFFKPALSHL